MADSESNKAIITELVFKRVENIVEKEKNAGYQHFLPPFSAMYPKPFSPTVKKIQDCMIKDELCLVISPEKWQTHKE